MNKTTTRILTASLVAGSLAWAGDLRAQAPFDDKAPIAKPTTARTAPTAPQGLSPADLNNIKINVDASNKLAGNEYQGFLVGHKVIEATITFTDSTKNYERYAWLKQIFGEHGCSLITENNTETKTGGMFNKVKNLSINAKVRGRGFVLKAIKDYYGGTLIGDPGQPVVPTDPQYKAIIDTEKQSQQLELDILAMSFNVDKLILERSKMGALDFSGKSRVDKALQDLKESRIPKAKGQLTANTAAIRQKFLDMADAAMNKKDYNLAIALISVSRDGSEKATWRLGGSYQGLGQYDKAISYFNGLTRSSYYGEKATNSIADCQHTQGNDREALNNLYKVLADFHGTQDELAALAKIDQWKLLDKASQFPELPQKLSGVYVEKSLQNVAGNRPQAVNDYAKAAESLAAGGNKAAASSQILSAANNANVANQQRYSQARLNAEQRFNNERATAQGQVNAWDNSYRNAISRARTDYGYELSRKRTALDDARRELDYLSRNPPAKPAGGTDPYGTKPGSSGTDPYGTKPSSSGTDPYGSKPSTSGSNTDPYAKAPARTGTDPYGGSTGSTGSNSGTDPYSGGSSGSTGTDPYATAMNDYNSRLSAARSKIDRLNSEYNWLYNNESAYVSDRTRSEAQSLQAARDELARYDLSKKEAYVNADSTVRSTYAAYADSNKRAQTLAGLAREAGL